MSKKQNQHADDILDKYLALFSEVYERSPSHCEKEGLALAAYEYGQTLTPFDYEHEKSLLISEKEIKIRSK